MHVVSKLRVVCAKHNNLNEMDKRRMKHFKYQFDRNRADIKKLSKLAEINCDPKKPIAHQPHCKYIMDELVRTDRRSRDLDMEFMLFYISLQIQDPSQ